MTNPTSNFGWQMPEPTDLVTNLPADFEVFGQAVDSDFADLLGGTTGQVLKKNTNADLDFVWGADSAGMTNPMTTTGDIIYSSPGSTPVRLGIGSASQVLTVASGVPSWATPAVAASALTLIAAPTTFSGSSAINVNNVFSATYENYLILLSLDSVSADDYFNFRTRVSGSDESGSYYNWALMANSSTSSGYDGGAGSLNSSYRLSYVASAGSGAGMVINVNNPFLTKYTNLNVQSNSNFSSTVGFRLTSGGAVANTTSYTGFTLFPASGNATGKVAVYGYSIS